MSRVFILSPARSDGVRAKFLFNPKTTIEMARELQKGIDQPIGKVFSFLSGLYFRGKLAYAQTFSRPEKEGMGAFVITSNRGLVPLDALIGLGDLRAFAEVPIEVGEKRYEGPLKRDIVRLSQEPRTEFVLLGSISTDKYVTALLEGFGSRLLFPIDFVGRGDMSRGGLMLRNSVAGTELTYAPLAGAVRKGKRPPKLTSCAFSSSVVK